MRKRLRRWAGYTALATSVVTMVGLGLTAPAALASTAGSAAVTGTQAKSSSPPQSSDRAPADATVQSADQNYTPAPCNATQTDGGAQCFAEVYTTVKNKIAADPDQPPPTALGPSDIQSAYNLPSASNGAGVTVAIVDAYGDSTAESDLATFRSFYGLAPCTTANGCFTKVAQDGSTNYPPDDSGWALETSLDLDAVSSACPLCHILLVEGDDNSEENLGESVTEAVNLGALYVSNSYGVPGEIDPSQPPLTTFDPLYDHPGVAVDAATGDTGDVVNWPASNPDVTGVGGTTLSKDPSVARGWDESAWGIDAFEAEGGGSGCSIIEPRPDYQEDINTDCPDNKAIADVAMDADPNSGLATYDTDGESGWLQVGGTSLATPLLTATYALAGTPTPGTFPVTYPYDDPNKANDLFDITQGVNGTCGDVLCQAGTGWDGPTGLGTPDGIGALVPGSRGTLTGKVTDKATGDPLVGATVKVGSFTATTDSTGTYSLIIPADTYTVTASDFGYKTVSGSVTVTVGQTTKHSFALNSVPSVILSGTVTDGSGEKWALYSKITIDGVPGTVYTNPISGRYSVSLPESSTYTLHIAPVLPGYVTKTVSVHLATADKVLNEKVSVDQSTCTAPGYAYKDTNQLNEQFTNWSGTTPQDGWTVTDNEGNGQVWEYSNPGNLPPPSGGDSHFATVDSDLYGIGNSQDTSLVSPVLDMSGDKNPALRFDSYYDGWPVQDAYVDLSLDGGQTWTNVYSQIDDVFSDAPLIIQIPQAAGQSDVQVRFHFTGTWGFWWSIDNVVIGDHTCSPNKAGLVEGVVTDANTGVGINGAKVVNTANASQFGNSGATGDPAIPDGYYWLVTNSIGNTQFKASDGNYVPATATVNVGQNLVTEQDYSLAAGHLTLSASSLSVTEQLGASKTKNLTFTDDGTQPVDVKLQEQGGGFTPMTGQASGAPLQQIKGNYAPVSVAAAKANGTLGTATKPAQTPSAPPWTNIANYPTGVMDNAAAYDSSTGDVYSISGINDQLETTASSYVYDPSTQAWSPIADFPAPVEAPVGTDVDGEVYVFGGWNEFGEPTTAAYVYDPSSNSWSAIANLPVGLTAPAVTTLDGKIYLIGGCTGDCAPTASTLYQYDPSSNSWTQLANYPVPVTFGMCAGIDEEIVCAGGTDGDTSATYTSTYIYSPSSNSWSQGANMPYDNWAAAYAGSGDALEVAGGVTSDNAVITNQAEQYDPSSDTWSALPNSNDAEYRGGSTCGLYAIGGSTGGFAPQNFAEVLPGFDQCGATDVPWLSESQTQFTVQPGQSVTVVVTVDSSTLAQPGTYTAKLAVETDDPYAVPAIPVTLTANPPASWGKIAGTVTDAGTGDPITGATVQICTMYIPSTGKCGPVTYTLKTDANGYYQLWLAQGFNPLQVVVAKDGYEPVVKVVTIIKGQTVTTNFALTKDSS